MDTRAWQIPAFDLLEFGPRQTRYCVSIPVINEGERIQRQLGEMQRIGIPELVDILVLDGGSLDGSTEPESLKAMGVRALLTKTGPGKLGAQLRMGYAYAMQQGYDGIVTVDGNGKDGVEDIPNFLTELDAGCDLVQGSRFVPGGEAIDTPIVRALAIKFIHAPTIRLASGFPYTDTTNGFRAYSRRFLLDPKVHPFRDVFQTYELLAYLSVRAPQLGFRTKEIPVRRQYAKDDKTPTKISPFRGNLLLLRILFQVLFGKFNP